MRKSPGAGSSPPEHGDESWRTGPTKLWEAPSAKSAIRAEIAKCVTPQIMCHATTDNRLLRVSPRALTPCAGTPHGATPRSTSFRTRATAAASRSCNLAAPGASFVHEKSTPCNSSALGAIGGAWLGCYILGIANAQAYQTGSPAGALDFDPGQESAGAHRESIPAVPVDRRHRGRRGG